MRPARFQRSSSQPSSRPSRQGNPSLSQIAAADLKHPAGSRPVYREQARAAGEAAGPALRSPGRRRRYLAVIVQAADPPRGQLQVQGPQRADRALLRLPRRYPSVHSGKEKCVELLLSYGLSLDEVDMYGQTPMFYAINENKVEIVRKYATKGTVRPMQNA